MTLEFGDDTTDRWTGHFSARAAWDVDGGSARGSAFASLADTGGGDVNAFVYDAYADVQRVGPLSHVRVGRQFDYDTPIVAWFDGALAEFAEFGKQRVTGGVFGGVPVHPYDASSRGDSLVGAWVAFHPWVATSLRADWMHVEDERSGLGLSNDLFGLAASEQVSERLRWNARYTRLEDRDRDFELSADWFDAKDAFSWRASWHRLLAEQQEHALELDPFFDQLLTLFPYDDLRFSTSKDFSAKFDAALGFDLRNVRDSNDVGPFNRDYQRVYATATITDVLPASLVLALTGERWHSSDSSVDTLGFDLSRRFDKTVDASLGSFFTLYLFDPFFGGERDDVRTYYLALRWRKSSSLSFEARYELEDADLGDFQLVRLGATWHF